MYSVKKYGSMSPEKRMVLRLTSLGVLGIGLCGTALFAGVPANELEWATVSDVGNPGYPGNRWGLFAGRGRVDYQYRITKYEVATKDWLEFANVFSMQSDELDDLLFAHASTSLRPDYTYQGPGNRYMYRPGIDNPELSPIAISWRMAAMYCNWLHNDKSSDPESLMDGAYDVSTFGIDGANFTDQSTHHPDAKYWISTLDEFLKAGYYDPNKNGNGPGWWLYGHSSDQPPVQGLPGEGDTIIGMSIDEVGVNPGFFPLGSFTNVVSPWGLWDIIGGEVEFVEEWDIDGFGNQRGRLTKWSSNTFGWQPEFLYDELWKFIAMPPWTTPGSFRVVSYAFNPADLNEDKQTNYFDVSVFINGFIAGDMRMDFDGDNTLSFGDVVVFLEWMR